MSGVVRAHVCACVCSLRARPRRYFPGLIPRDAVAQYAAQWAQLSDADGGLAAPWGLRTVERRHV